MAKKSKDLTEKQRKVFDFIVSHKEEKGFPPTVLEIQNEFGYRSSTIVTKYLRALQKKGYVILHKNVSRGIEVLKKEEELFGIGKTKSLLVDNKYFPGAIFGMLAKENIGEIQYGDVVVVGKAMYPLRFAVILVVSVDEQVHIVRYLGGKEKSITKFGNLTDSVKVIGQVIGIMRRTNFDAEDK